MLRAGENAMPKAVTTIRELRPSDRQRWDVLWGGYLIFYEQSLSAEVTELTWRRLIDPGSDLHGLVALDGENVVGFTHYLFHDSTWSINGYCYLEDLFVDPTIRGKGAGRALIEGVYRKADERGLDRVYWMTRNDNAQARVLYDQLARLTPFVQYARDR
jgi:GNAT superfamily N-acetyltransferase